MRSQILLLEGTVYCVNYEHRFTTNLNNTISNAQLRTPSTLTKTKIYFRIHHALICPYRKVKWIFLLFWCDYDHVTRKKCGMKTIFLLIQWRHIYRYFYIFWLVLVVLNSGSDVSLQPHGKLMTSPRKWRIRRRGWRPTLILLSGKNLPRKYYLDGQT